jgi:hypothetical protein
MRVQMAFDILVSLAICAAFAVLVVSVFYRLDSAGSLQLSSVSSMIARASTNLNYSIYPEQEFGIVEG